MADEQHPAQPANESRGTDPVSPPAAGSAGVRRRALLKVGAAGYLMRRRDGVNWAVLFNSRSTADGKPLMIRFRDESAETLNGIARWPAVDQWRLFAA